MKQRCIHCGKTYEGDKKCPFCSGDNDFDAMNDEEIHKLHRHCHQKINENTEMKNSGLTFLTVGTILLIIGGIFFFLSFRKDIIGIRNFTPGSTEFVLSVLALSTSVAFLSFGCYRLIRALKNLKFYHKVIQDTKR